MRTYDDHSLEFWGDVFQACRLAGEGVSFEDFIIDPQRTLQDFGMDDALEILESGFLPLLPKQARVRKRLDHALSIGECVNVLLFSPTRLRQSKTSIIRGCDERGFSQAVA